MNKANSNDGHVPKCGCRARSLQRPAGVPSGEQRDSPPKSNKSAEPGPPANMADLSPGLAPPGAQVTADSSHWSGGQSGLNPAATCTWRLCPWVPRCDNYSLLSTPPDDHLVSALLSVLDPVPCLSSVSHPPRGRGQTFLLSP